MMDSESNSSSFNTKSVRSVTERFNWALLTPGHKTILKLFLIALLFIATVLTVSISQKQQNITQKAASPDQLEAEGGVLGGNATIISDTNASGGQSVRFSASAPTQNPSPTPTPTPTSGKIVNVSSIAALKTALTDNTVDEIVVVNGIYRISTAASQASDSLWIGSQFAGRTRPILVRAETTGGVTFDGGGAGGFGGISFEQGAHDQTWQGFKFVNGSPRESGVIVYGGYSGYAPPHHITLRNIEISGLKTAADGLRSGHAIYFSKAASPGPHDLLIDGLTVVDTGQIKAALHFYHDYLSGAGDDGYNTQNVTIRNAHISGTDQAVMIWARTINNVLIEDSTITGARIAVRYEYGNGITLRRVTSTGSSIGFYSLLGPNPPGVTFIDTSLK